MLAASTGKRNVTACMSVRLSVLAYSPWLTMGPHAVATRPAYNTFRLGNKKDQVIVYDKNLSVFRAFVRPTGMC